MVALILPITALAAGDTDAIINAFKEIFVSIGAAIVVIGWIIAGILYLTAAGSPERIGTAKKALIACVIGTVLIIISATAYTFVKSALNIGGGAGGGAGDNDPGGEI